MTMYKLLIADDEPLERRAIRYFIDDSHLEIGEILESETGTATVKQLWKSNPTLLYWILKCPD